MILYFTNKLCLVTVLRSELPGLSMLWYTTLAYHNVA
ncbi:hypothetical protein C366_04292 [Cryptococcus neoformans Tu401-1]|nr:hypothetical protein C366_04292 [Cryptococcus neoformans var. grubii Tu401-1]OXM78337.1 hypothetical protein C364_04276 [Cryptococcus neoformans var. grubii Bt63]